MKRDLRKIVLAVLFPTMTITAFAQYQLPNSGFEGAWEPVSQGGVSGTEPSGWNSFVTMVTASFIYKSARANKIAPSDDCRPGSSGKQSAKLWSNKAAFGIIANGNLTTGRIYGGSTTPTDASGNYNYSDPNESGFNQTFTGKPDSLVSWVKYVPSSTSEQASISVIIHEYSRYQDPEARGYTNVVAKAQRSYYAASDKGWQRISIPFAYESGNKNPAYILASYTSNKTPGKGNNGDAVNVDDIEMVYNSKASSVKFDGVDLWGFDKDKYTYEGIKYATSVPGAVDVLVDGVSAIAESNIESQAKKVTVVVKGGDISQNGSNMHTYTFTFRSKLIVTAATNNPTFGSAEFTHSEGGNDVYDGENVTFTATPAANCYFVNWTDVNGNEVSTSAVYKKDNITANMELKANFVAKENSDLSFENRASSVIVGYARGNSYTNPAGSTSSKGAITYMSSNSSMTVDADGVVTMKAKGTTTITATQAEWGKYLETSVSYILNAVNPKTPSIRWKDAGVVTKDLGDGSYTPELITDSKGALSYESDNIGVATIDAKGIITLVNKGSANITVNQARETGNGWIYGNGAAEYLLQIVPTGVENNELSAVKVWLSGDQLNLCGVEEGDIIKVFTANGMIVYDGVAVNGTITVDIHGRGLVIVKINDNAFKVVKK